MYQKQNKNVEEYDSERTKVTVTEKTRKEGGGGVNEMEKRDLVSESDGKCREIWLRNLNITAAC